MKIRILILLLITLLFSCSKDEIGTNHVLMLKVDYETNSFEGGTEFNFPKQADNFTIINEYVAPSDFGSAKLIYKELNETLFNGTIHWMGLGEITYPKSLMSSDKFKSVTTKDIVYPENGFENVFNPSNQEYEYVDTDTWLSVQHLVKVREYLKSNPSQKVKVFLYTPSVGVDNPESWSWILYLKK